MLLTLPTLPQHCTSFARAAASSSTSCPATPSYVRLSEGMCELLVDSGAEDPLGAAYALSNLVIASASTAPITERASHAPVAYRDRSAVRETPRRLP